MNRSQLEHIIRASAAILATDQFVIVGSQSILGAYPHPPDALAESIEADIYPMDTPANAEILSATIGEESHFHGAFGVYADGVSEETSILPAGWRDRLVKVQNENTAGAIGWCLDPTDLAIAKHIAGRKKDVQFTAAMALHGMIDESAFAERLKAVDVPPEHRERVLRRFGVQAAAAVCCGSPIRDESRADPNTTRDRR